MSESAIWTLRMVVAGRACLTRPAQWSIERNNDMSESFSRACAIGIHSGEVANESVKLEAPAEAPLSPGAPGLTKTPREGRDDWKPPNFA